MDESSSEAHSRSYNQEILWLLLNWEVQHRGSLQPPVKTILSQINPVYTLVPYYYTLLPTHLF